MNLKNICKDQMIKVEEKEVSNYYRHSYIISATSISEVINSTKTQNQSGSGFVVYYTNLSVDN